MPYKPSDAEAGKIFDVHAHLFDTKLLPALTHNYGTEWKSDSTDHWRERSRGAKSGEDAHSGGAVIILTFYDSKRSIN